MRKILMLVVMVVMAVVAMAQTPNKISYQAVIRDGQNRLVTNSDVTVFVKIGGYEETFSVTTNANGLVSLQIPTDAKQTVFNAIDWTSTNTITTTVTIVSTSEAMTSTVPVSAVPYSLYANTVNPAVFDVIYDKIQADSVVLQDSILATATAIRGEMSAMQNALQHNIDTTSSQIRHDMNTMTSDLQDNIDSTSVNVRKALVDTAANIRSAVNTNAANIATNKQAIIDSAHNIRTEMAAMTSDLQDNIDSTSVNVRKALVDTAGNIRIDVNAKFAALATVATTGSYTDLINVPVGLVDSNFVRGQISDTADVLRGEIAAAQVQADWNEDVATSKAYIKNKPDLTVYATNAKVQQDSTVLADSIKKVDNKFADYTKTVDLATVATTGSYTDLINVPVGLVDSNFVRGQISDTADVLRGEIAAAQVQADWNEDVATSKAYIKNKPTLMDSLAVIRTVKDTADAIRSAIPEVGEGKYYIVNPVTGEVIDSILVNFADNKNVKLPGNPLTLKFVNGSDTVFRYNAFEDQTFEPGVVDNKYFVIDISEITTQAIVKYINKAQATSSVNDVDSIYNALTDPANADVKEALIRKAKQVAINHERDAMDIALYYFKHFDGDDVRYILDRVDSADIAHFINSVNTLTPADANKIMGALAANVNAAQVGQLVRALSNRISAAQAREFINAVIGNIDASQVDVIIDALNDAANANPNSAAGRWKARVDAHINSLIDAKIQQHVNAYQHTPQP